MPPSVEWRDDLASIARRRSGYGAFVTFYGLVAMLHVTGWGLYLRCVDEFPALVGLGVAAYLLGLRHALDADHIAAIDDTVRLLVQQGGKPIGAGFWFALGHSTVVLLLAIVASLAAVPLAEVLPGLKDTGVLVGTGISAGFLLLVGTLNLLVLRDIVKVWRRTRSGSHDDDRFEQVRAGRGLLGRVVGGRLRGLVRRSWQMFPIGFLFGLGLDSATEVGLLAMSVGASASGSPLLATLSLPLLFAAGMSLVDTTDSVLMTRACAWALVDPMRKLAYNATTTALSVAVALGVGTIELLQVFARLQDRPGELFVTAAGIDFGSLGIVFVALFASAWLMSMAARKAGRPLRRFTGRRSNPA